MAAKEEIPRLSVSIRAGLFLNYSSKNKSDTWHSKLGSKEWLSDVVDEYENAIKPYEIAFISLKENEINALSLIQKSTRVATQKTRVIIRQTVSLDTALGKEEVKQFLDPNDVPEWEQIWTQSSVRISANLWNQLLVYLREHREDVDKIRGSLYALIPAKNKEPKNQILVHEKDAVTLALKIAEMNEYDADLERWDTSQTDTDGFFDQLQTVQMREDAMIINDYRLFDDWKEEKLYKFNTVEFTNGKRRLTIYNANRMPLEKTLGVDLIYHDIDTDYFIMVQYKRMAKSPSLEKWAYYFSSDDSLEKELDAMKAFEENIPNSDGGSILDYRISREPFYFKFCPSTQNGEGRSLCSGFYLTKAFFQRLRKDGRAAITHENAPKYLTNTQLLNFVQSGFIGTHIGASVRLKTIISESLKTGKSIVIARAKNRES